MRLSILLLVSLPACAVVEPSPVYDDFSGRCERASEAPPEQQQAEIQWLHERGVTCVLTLRGEIRAVPSALVGTP